MKLVALSVQQSALTALKLRLHQHMTVVVNGAICFPVLYTPCRGHVTCWAESTSLLHYSDTTFGESSFMFAETILEKKDHHNDSMVTLTSVHVCL